MPKNKDVINNLPLIGAGAGATIGIINGLSSGNLFSITDIAIGAGAGTLIGYQAKKTLQNKDKNKTKIGISSTCAIGAAALNIAFNPHATVMNTVQAGAGGVIIGKGGKFIVAKATNTPQYQLLNYGYNIHKKSKKTKDFDSIKKQINKLDSQKKYVKKQNKSNAL